jgi:hypothetical protein
MHIRIQKAEVARSGRFNDGLEWALLDSLASWTAIAQV